MTQIDDASVGLRRVRQELLQASDHEIEDAVGYADPMMLRALVHQLTGDEDLIAINVKLASRGFFQVSVPETEQETAFIREKATKFLMAYRDSGAGNIEIGPMDRLKISISLALGKEVPDEEVDLWVTELGLDPWARSLKWKQPPRNEQLAKFSVLVIGAGMGGLNAAVQLKRAGIPYTVLEKNSGVGGTWFENRYPGARVDTASRSYTHIFGVDFPYPYAFCPWTETLKYFNWVADTFEVRDDIRFNTEVRAVIWDELSSTWEISADGPNGRIILHANAVISAVGFLNRPSIPEISGSESFRGDSWHSSRWPEDVDLSGKRVAVIGTASTGCQIIPELALEVGHLTVFQRTPQWLFNFPGYLKPLPLQVNWLDRNFPFHTNFMRLPGLYRVASAGALGILNIDPDFNDPHAISADNKRFRDMAVGFLKQKLGDPDLVEKMTPSHVLFSARPVLVDSGYSILDAIQQENVTLVTEGIRQINESGVESNDGRQHEVDYIVYASGFRANDYLYPMTVKGRGGENINEFWSDGPRAYLGCMVPRFPNFWVLYGPNTNGGLSVASFEEQTMLYALKCLERLVLEDRQTIEVNEKSYRRYNRMLDERGANKAYSDPRTRSYYWSEYGRSITNCPLGGVEMWQLLKEPDYNDLEIR